MTRLLWIAIAAVSLAACANSGQSGSPSPAASVFAAKTAYAGALSVAVRYNALPRCGQPASPPICSDQGVIVQMRKASDVAAGALDSAESIVRQPGVRDSLAIAAAATATEAVKVLQLTLLTYGVK